MGVALVRANSADLTPVWHVSIINWIKIAAIVLIVLSYVALLTLDAPAAQNDADEDGVIESFGAALSLIASYLFLLCYLNSSSRTMPLARRTAALWLRCYGEALSDNVLSTNRVSHFSSPPGTPKRR